jgi:hypothetical protein
MTFDWLTRDWNDIVLILLFVGIIAVVYLAVLQIRGDDKWH